MNRILPVLILAVIGCGSGEQSDLVAVTGTVTLDGDPIGHTLVTFMPIESTPGHGGSATTDAAGKYVAMTSKGKKGLPPGTYKVVVSRRLYRDGTPPPPDEKPIESQASETLPARYSDAEKTELLYKLAAGETKPYDLKLRKKK